MLLNLALVVLAYLAGSLSSAVILCKLMRLDDPRLHGSKNPGTTNVLRLHGKKVAALTLAGDVVKGLLPVLAAHYLLLRVDSNNLDLVVALTALAAFCGHLFPVFFGFNGGKGVATFIGVLFGMYWPLGLAFVGIWLAMAFLFRYSSLAGLTAAALAPVVSAWLHSSRAYIVTITIMAMLLFWRHRSNIRNLLEGNEDKLDKNG
ncbi:MAG: glycerol-3-phosphate 1-O-acyltransferase PlsY, partial [Gammaproteobacteria bacterium]